MSGKAYVAITVLCILGLVFVLFGWRTGLIVMLAVFAINAFYSAIRTLDE